MHVQILFTVNTNIGKGIDFGRTNLFIIGQGKVIFTLLQFEVKYRENNINDQGYT